MYDNDDAFLSSLQFPEMRLRQEAVKDAHSNTFEWVFQDNQNDSPARQFPTWLKEGNGIFWIRGKAGSGKSTLMKYLTQNSHTQDLLKTWAGSQQLVISRYFFWNAGSRLQKAREGLIQTILFELLRSCPDAISVVRKSLRYPTEPGLWTMSELMAATKSPVTCDLPKKVCIFIDGLDEHEGELDDLIELIDQLASSPNVKICCSSRPWPIFTDAFGQDHNRMLKLEDLTKEDIRKYVTDSFQRHKRFHKYSRDTRFAMLLQDVAHRSNGVFLWVTLVVKSLLNGLTNADTITDLERRLAAMPSDLGGLYWRMIDSVDPFYKRKSSELLLMVGGAWDNAFSGNPPLVAYFINLLDEFDDDPSILVHGTTADLLGNPPEWRDDMVRKLDARTKGLVELSASDAIPDACFLEKNRGDLEKNGGHFLEVLHRSVYDFLRAPKVIEALRETCPQDFDPLKRLFDASLILLLSPTIPLPRAHGSHAYNRKIEHLLTYSGKYEERDGTPPKDHLRAASQRYPFVEWADPLSLTDTNVTQTFLSLAVYFGLDLYVAEVLRDDSELVRNDLKHSYRSCLEMALWRNVPISSNTIQLLLENGASTSRPEGGSKSTTAWYFLLDNICLYMNFDGREPCKRWEAKSWLKSRFRSDEEMKDIFASFISHGAALSDEHNFAGQVIHGLFSHQDVEYLLSLSPSL